MTPRLLPAAYHPASGTERGVFIGVGLGKSSKATGAAVALGRCWSQGAFGASELLKDCDG
jgi:hypothetical protein